MTMVTVEIPKDLLTLAGMADQSPKDSASKLIALELFREDRISLGRAAELAGISVESFMEFSGNRGVPLHYSETELMEDRETAERLKL